MNRQFGMESTCTGHSLFPGSILQQLCVHFIAGQLYVSHHRAANETIFHRSVIWRRDIGQCGFIIGANYPIVRMKLYLQHVWVLFRIIHTDVCQFDVEILVDGMQCATNTMKDELISIFRCINAVISIKTAIRGARHCHWRLTSNRFWAPPPHLCPPAIWKMNKITAKYKASMNYWKNALIIE